MSSFFDHKIKALSLTGLLTALCCVTTMTVRIPIPATGGYVHPGDGLVLLSGLLLGPVYGTFAAGVGSALADLLAGYLVYAPATLVIKGVTALISAALFGILTNKKHHPRLGTLLAGIFAEGWMVFGYFLFECFLYNPPTALIAAPANVLQGVFGVGLCMVLFPLLKGQTANL